MKALQISNITKIIRWHWIRGLYRHISISGHKKRSTQNDNWHLLLQIRIKYCHWDDKLLLLFIVQTTCHSKYMRKWERSQCRLQPCPNVSNESEWVLDSVTVFYVSFLASSISCTPCVLGFRLCLGVQNCNDVSMQLYKIVANNVKTTDKMNRNKTNWNDNLKRK